MTGDGFDFAALEAENRHLSDRDLMIRNLQRTNEALTLIRAQNGAVARISADLYGDTAHAIMGVKPMVREHDQAIDRARTTMRTVLTIVGIIGVGNLITLATLLAN